MCHVVDEICSDVGEFFLSQHHENGVREKNDDEEDYNTRIHPKIQLEDYKCRLVGKEYSEVVTIRLKVF